MIFYCVSFFTICSNEAVEKLDEREKLIMELRFGLNNRPEKTQKAVAEMCIRDRDQLDEKLRNDPRVVSMEKTDIRNCVGTLPTVDVYKRQILCFQNQLIK